MHVYHKGGIPHDTNIIKIIHPRDMDMEVHMKYGIYVRLYFELRCRGVVDEQIDIYNPVFLVRIFYRNERGCLAHRGIKQWAYQGIASGYGRISFGL